eukprot:m.63054 g.63054  ORF g.63054 m.63054 type:complete len:96 (+) comp7170_c0_seq1:21-308(+)
MEAATAAYWQAKTLASLHDCISFWMRHSLDGTHGGYHTCLDRDGSLFDSKKYIWLQGRQVDLFATLMPGVDALAPVQRAGRVPHARDPRCLHIWR